MDLYIFMPTYSFQHIPENRWKDMPHSTGTVIDNPHHHPPNHSTSSLGGGGIKYTMRNDTTQVAVIVIISNISNDQ